jgi:hypothetical protein
MHLVASSIQWSKYIIFLLIGMQLTESVIEGFTVEESSAASI